EFASLGDGALEQALSLLPSQTIELIGRECRIASGKISGGLIGIEKIHSAVKKSGAGDAAFACAIGPCQHRDAANSPRSSHACGQPLALPDPAPVARRETERRRRHAPSWSACAPGVDRIDGSGC